jgi:hypothetical protein
MQEGRALSIGGFFYCKSCSLTEVAGERDRHSSRTRLRMEACRTLQTVGIAAGKNSEQEETSTGKK